MISKLINFSTDGNHFNTLVKNVFNFSASIRGSGPMLRYNDNNNNKSCPTPSTTMRPKKEYARSIKFPVMMPYTKFISIGRFVVSIIKMSYNTS